MKTYLDSSSFAKRFIEESGSARAEEVCAAASELALSVLCVPEVVSALNRRRRERLITADQYDAAKRSLVEDVRDADIIDLTASVVASSVNILEASPVRTLDALHIACAVAWEAELFVSSDMQQISAAQRAGLKTEKV